MDFCVADEFIRFKVRRCWRARFCSVRVSAKVIFFAGTEADNIWGGLRSWTNDAASQRQTFALRSKFEFLFSLSWHTAGSFSPVLVVPVRSVVSSMVSLADDDIMVARATLAATMTEATGILED
jgi:hypothetical protein